MHFLQKFEHLGLKTVNNLTIDIFGSQTWNSSWHRQRHAGTERQSDQGRPGCLSCEHVGTINFW